MCASDRGMEEYSLVVRQPCCVIPRERSDEGSPGAAAPVAPALAMMANGANNVCSVAKDA